MLRTQSDRVGIAVVVGVSLVSAFWFQTARSVRIGMPGSMPRSQSVVTTQADPGSEDSRLKLTGTIVNRLDQPQVP